MLLINKRLLRSFDWINFAITTTLACIGLAFIFSATYKPDQPYSLFFKKQAFGFATGFIIYVVASFTDYRSIMRWGYFAYLVVLGLLIFTLVKGHIGMGGQRWINFGIINIQPSELAKLLFPAFTAYFFYTHDDDKRHQISLFLPILALLGFSFLLIVKQPDLGTALILVFTGFTMLWMAGISHKFFLYGTLCVLLSAPISWHMLKPYQKNRIFVFLGYGDTRKERYQIEQSKIAIGSGGLWGKGFLRGTQNKLHFLPESRTDFIFSVIAEEMGFVGTFFLLLLYAMLFLRFFAMITLLPSHAMQLFALGIIAHIIISAIVNIGMVIDLLPVVGIPLPLVSYGVSNLWITFASLGIFNSITSKRQGL